MNDIDNTEKLCHTFDEFFAKILVDENVDPHVLSALIIARLVLINETMGIDKELIMVMEYAIKSHMTKINGALH